MHEITLLVNIVVTLVVAFIGGIITRRLGLHTIVGYLLTASRSVHSHQASWGIRK